jgi:hypothetical protein
VGAFAWFSLPELSLTVPRSYLLIKNLFWGMIGLIAGTGLLSGWRWALPFSIWGAVLFTAFQLFDVLILRGSRFALQTQPFNVAATLGVLLLLLWLLTRPGTQSFFRRNSE